MKKEFICKGAALTFIMALSLSLRVGFPANAQNNESIVPQQTELEGQRKDESLPSAEFGLNNPRIIKNTGPIAGAKVTWDCVYFGSYPQPEVVSSAETYTALDKEYVGEEALIEDSSLYHTLQNEVEWDNKNDTIVNGDKYHRMKQKDATWTDYEEDREHFYYHWADSDTYHYFKYEPIKWRVLKVNGEQAFLMSDITLDEQFYNTVKEDISWETSTIRSWLNGYDASFNQQGNDYSSRNFISRAFSANERLAIADTFVINEDNIAHRTDGGNDTTDKIFFLSLSEVYGDSAQAHGFAESDVSRRSKSSTYAKAMGTWSGSMYEKKGNCRWWLRSPGAYRNAVAFVDFHGYVSDSGTRVGYCGDGVRPALNLNLSSEQWMPAGTVCTGEAGNGDSEDSGNTDGNGNGDYIEDNGNGGNSGDTSTNSIKVSNITITSSLSNKIAVGKKVTLKVAVSPENAANKRVIWSSGNPKVATVNQSGVVVINKKAGGKTVTITATAADGSKVSKGYKLTSMKGVVKKIDILGKKRTKAGHSLQLKAKVTATRKANKKLKWTCSNKKYATVSNSGKVKTRKAGKGRKVKITAMATDGSGKKKSIVIKIM